MLAAARGLQLAERGDALERRLLPWMFATLESHLAGRPDGSACQPATGLLGDADGNCPIDRQALWFNALLAGVECAREAGDERRYLADSWRLAGGPDLRLRGRQVAALALPHALLPREKAATLLDVLASELLTPVGLRTLAPSDPGYVGGDDGAAGPHEGRGSAWPSLACGYFDALLRVSGEDGKRAARAWLRAFEPRLDEAALGFVGARFDGDSPHAARGPLASAAAVGELLRLTVRLGPLRR